MDRMGRMFTKHGVQDGDSGDKSAGTSQLEKHARISGRGITRAARDGIVASVSQHPVAGTLGGPGGGGQAARRPSNCLGGLKGFHSNNDELVIPTTSVHDP